MGRTYDEIDDRFARLVEGQPRIGPPESTRSVIVVDIDGLPALDGA